MYIVVNFEWFQAMQSPEDLAGSPAVPLTSTPSMPGRWPAECTSGHRRFQSTQRPSKFLRLWKKIGRNRRNNFMMFEIQVIILLWVLLALLALLAPELSCMSVQFTLRTMSRELHVLLLCSFGKCPTGGVLLASRHVRCAILCEYFVSTKQWKPAQRAISFAGHPALCCFRQEA